jgi:hypothetical protein
VSSALDPFGLVSAGVNAAREIAGAFVEGWTGGPSSPERAAVRSPEKPRRARPTTSEPASRPTEEPVADAALEECRKQGASFLSEKEMETLGAVLFLPGTHAANTALVGRPATAIAELAGCKVPPETRVLVARMQPAQVGREFPLSAEKLSPILAFYRVVDAEAAIDLCRRLLEFGGMGHTCSIHSRDEAVIRRFGEQMPAFRICVNTSAVHGAIGYSTNLFPAMTLGCGALGGNITSDNIGPMHLLNIKRIAWEARPVDHHTVPASERMADGANAPTAASSTVGHAARQTVSEVANPSRIASELADRVFSSSSRKNIVPPVAQAPMACAAAPKASAAEVAAPAVTAFVSESDVRVAISRGEKILLGRRSIVTPSARDLGSAHDVFVETDGS